MTADGFGAGSKRSELIKKAKGSKLLGDVANEVDREEALTTEAPTRPSDPGSAPAPPPEPPAPPSPEPPTAPPPKPPTPPPPKPSTPPPPEPPTPPLPKPPTPPLPKPKASEHLAPIPSWVSQIVARTRALAGSIPAMLSYRDFRITGVLIVLLILLIALGFYAYRLVNPRSGSRTLTISVSPPQTRIELDGKQVSERVLQVSTGKHVLVATLSGYSLQQKDVEPGNQEVHVFFVLTRAHPGSTPGPTPPSLSVQFEGNFEKQRVSVDGIEQSENPKIPLDKAKHRFLADSPTGASAELEFEMQQEGPARIQDLVLRRNTSAVIVSSFKDRVIVYAGPKPLSVKMDNRSLGLAGATGLPVQLPPNASPVQLTVGEGQEATPVSVQESDSPLLQIFGKTDTNRGAIRVLTNQDDAQILIDNKPEKRKVRNGHVTTSGLKPGDHTVVVAKDGFCSRPAGPQTIPVKAGEIAEARFNLAPNPSLQLEGVPAGAKVFLDNNEMTVFNILNLQPTVHPINVLAVGYEYLSDTVQLSCGSNMVYDVTQHLRRVSQAPPPSSPPSKKATLIVKTDPRDATVIASGPEGVAYTDFSKPRDVAPGTYKFHASLDGYDDADETAELRTGESKTVNLKLSRKVGSWSPPLSVSSNSSWRRAPSLSIFGNDNASGIYEFQIRKRGAFNPIFGSWILAYRTGGLYSEFRIQGKQLEYRQVNSPRWVKLGDVETPSNANALYVRVRINGTSVTHEVGPNKSSLKAVGSTMEFPRGAMGLTKGTEIMDFAH